jgi:adenylyltransferase/sulfurtransferase
VDEPAPARLSRDARHLALPQVGAEGQARIASGKVLLIGAGGLGNAAAAYVAAAGVGELVVADFDRVDASNLGRQFLFGPADIGERKVEVLARRLAEINPDVRLSQVPIRIDASSVDELVAAADIVLDGSDNFRTRFVVADACVRHAKALVAGSAIRLEGQVATFGPDYDDSPCYRCVYSEADESLEDCAGNGVFSPVPGVVGTLMAVDALKLLAGLPVQRGHLTLFDGVSSEFHSVRVRKSADCRACS